MFRRRMTFLILLTFLLLTSMQQTHAQNGAPGEAFSAGNQPESRVLPALLDEMRRLRLMLETFNQRQLRSTIVLERIKRQETRIEVLKVEVNESRKQIRELSKEGRFDDDQEELKEVETAINETGDPCSRTHLTQEYARLKRALGRRKKADNEELERQRALELQINSQLEVEITRLTDLDNLLEELEREMDKQLAETEKVIDRRK